MYEIKLTKEELYLIYQIRRKKWGKIQITLFNGKPEVIKIEETKKPALLKSEDLTKILKRLQ